MFIHNSKKCYTNKSKKNCFRFYKFIFLVLCIPKRNRLHQRHTISRFIYCLHCALRSPRNDGKRCYFPGANDNASGCAMLLNLAKYYSLHPPEYSVVFMAFGAEEVGLIGSKYYIEHQLFNIKQIKFLINFDIVGTGDEGIKVVNATEHKKEFDELVKINEEKKYLLSVQPRGKAHISDHYFFEEAGVKTFYIYTLGGIKAYHDIYDRPETLPLTKFKELYKLVIDFSDTLQK